MHAMKCRSYSRFNHDGADDRIVFVIEPDDLEELIPVAADDSEAREETVPPGLIVMEPFDSFTATAYPETGWTFYGEGLIPQLKRSLGIE